MTCQCKSGTGNCRFIRLVAGYMHHSNVMCEAIQLQTRRPQRKRTYISAVSVSNREGRASVSMAKAAIPASHNWLVRELPRRRVGGMRGKSCIVNREVARCPP